ncbi:MAG: ABC transporter substrate-binding protein [Anaerolineae bacterium]|nr:ABC transporter substrate-binding protein [Anaerolineae bacterium]
MDYGKLQSALRLSVPLLILTLLSGMLALMLSGCTESSSESVTLRVGVLPILDALPLYVAESEGFFAEAGVQVTLIPVASAAERDQLLQAGQLDGVISDLVAVALYNREVPRLLVLRYAMQATATTPQFRILAAGDSALVTPSDLREVPIGLSQGTVIEYVTNRVLQQEGLLPAQIVGLAVPRIPDRLALLEAGQLQAVTLPEPLASLAVQQGARVIVDDTHHPQFSCSVFAFSREFVTAQPQAIRAFLVAIERASTLINADKTRWDEYLISQALVPQPVLGTYTLPDYPSSAIPSREQFEDVVHWLQEKTLLTADVAYADSVDGSFLP